MEPVKLSSNAGPDATIYGSMIDHLWAVNGRPGEMGKNLARRSRWPEGVTISVEPFEDEEIAEMPEGMAMSHGVFIISDDVMIEYTSPEDDMAATDWLIYVS